MTDPNAPQAGQPTPPPNAYQTPPAQPNPYQAAPGAPAAPAAPLTEAEDKQWASFAHFGGILGFLPALIIFLIFKDRGARTRVEAKEALNWQITWIAANIILQILLAILGGILGAVLPWGAYLAISGIFGVIGFLPYIANVIFSIMGGVKVNNGGSYRYPVAIRLIK